MKDFVRGILNISEQQRGFTKSRSLEIRDGGRYFKLVRRKIPMSNSVVKIFNF